MSSPQTYEAQPSSSVGMSRLVNYKHKQDTGFASLPNLPSTSFGKPPTDSWHRPLYSPMPAPSVLPHVFFIVALTSQLSYRSTPAVMVTPMSTFLCQIALNSSATEVISLRFPGTPSPPPSPVVLAPQSNLWIPMPVTFVVE